MQRDISLLRCLTEGEYGQSKGATIVEQRARHCGAMLAMLAVLSRIGVLITLAVLVMLAQLSLIAPLPLPALEPELAMSLTRTIRIEN